MAAILNQWVPPHLQIPNREEDYELLSYVRCQIKAPGGEGFLEDPGSSLPKAHVYFQYHNEWRIGEDPHQVRGLFPIMAIVNLVIFTVTLVMRIAQTIVILGGVFFRAHAATYEKTNTPEFQDFFFNALERELGMQNKGFQKVWTDLVRDGKCFIGMEIAAGLGTFTSHPRKIVQMQMIWGTMENEWNSYRSYTDTPIAKVTRWLKHECPTAMPFAEQMSQIANILPETNHAFYLYEYAQVRSPELQARLHPVGDRYESYRDLAVAIQAQAASLGKQNV